VVDHQVEKQWQWLLDVLLLVLPVTLLDLVGYLLLIVELLGTSLLEVLDCQEKEDSVLLDNKYILL
jgi:hypothetical protein